MATNYSAIHDNPEALNQFATEDLVTAVLERNARAVGDDVVCGVHVSVQSLRFSMDGLYAMRRAMSSMVALFYV